MISSRKKKAPSVREKILQFLHKLKKPKIIITKTYIQWWRGR